jgi:hypothetical protein
VEAPDHNKINMTIQKHQDLIIEVVVAVWDGQIIFQSHQEQDML